MKTPKKAKHTFMKTGTQPMPKGGKSYRTQDDMSEKAPRRKKFAGVSQVAKRRNYPVE